MILTCEQCETRYLVPGRSIGVTGRRVRCSNCGHEWFEEPEDETPQVIEEPDDIEEIEEDQPETFAQAMDDAAEDIEPIPESVKPKHEKSEVPVIPGADAGKKGLKVGVVTGYAAAACVLLVVMGGFVVARNTVVDMWPASMVFYDMAGLETKIDGENLIFDQLKAVAEPDEHGEVILKVDANILNLSRDEEHIPSIQASLVKEGGEVADSWLAEQDVQIVEKEGEVPFVAVYPDLPSDIKEVNVKFIPGTKVEEVATALSGEGGKHAMGEEGGEGHDDGHGEEEAEAKEKSGSYLDAHH